MIKVKNKKQNEVRGPLSYDQEKDVFSIGGSDLKSGDALFLCYPVEEDDWLVADSRIKKGKKGWFIEDFDRSAFEFLGILCVSQG